MKGDRAGTTSKRTGVAGAAAVFLIFGAAAGACDGLFSEEDASAQRACAEFRATAGDFRDGTLDVDELTERLRAVREHARRSRQPRLADHAEALVAGTDDDGMPVRPVEDLVEACRSMGH